MPKPTAKTPTGKRPVPLKLPHELVAKLDEAASTAGISRNAYVEGAIRQRLGEGAAAPDRRTPPVPTGEPRYTCPDHGGFHVGLRCTMKPGCTAKQRKVSG